uniref:Uncharacterized protein n=1 Tax=Globodera rostochiensis TaxID=31243 RepID=A0A914H4W6_GLORO
MHVDFDPIQVDWSSLFANGPGDTGARLCDNDTTTVNSSATVFMRGGNAAAGYPVFTGVQYQRGSGGLGSMFRSFLRFMLPIGRQAGKAIGRQGLETGARVLSSVLDGNDLKQSLVNEGRAGLKNLLDKAADNVAKSQQKGSGGGNFDFKRYRKNLEGPTTTQQAPPLGRLRIKRGKRTGFFSPIGPTSVTAAKKVTKSVYSTHPHRRKRAASKSSKTAGNKHSKPSRYDSLGAY